MSTWPARTLKTPSHSTTSSNPASTLQAAPAPSSASSGSTHLNRRPVHLPPQPRPSNIIPMPRLLIPALLLLTLPAFAADVHVRVDPSARPAAPGNENLTTFPTIVNALDHHPFATPNPNGTPGRVFIEIVPGTYHERVIVTQNHNNITLIGLGKTPDEVVITNSLNARTAGGTFFTETVEINGTGFEADNITFENAAGNTGQAVAVADRGDRSIFKHCRFLGHQDTLFADYGRQYYVDSYIEGGVDYIFGNAAAVFERDELHSNGPGFITAQSRTSPDQPTGYVLLSSKVTVGFEAPPAPPASTPTAEAGAARRMIGQIGR